MNERVIKKTCVQCKYRRPLESFPKRARGGCYGPVCNQCQAAKVQAQTATIKREHSGGPVRTTDEEYLDKMGEFAEWCNGHGIHYRKAMMAAVARYMRQPRSCEDFVRPAIEQHIL